MFEIPPASLPQTVKLLAGRMPDQSDPSEALASYTLARDKGVRLGSVIQVVIPTPAQIKLGRSKVKPSDLPRRSVRVVGLVVTENEFPSGTGDRYDLFVTRAYAAAVNPHAMVVSTYYVRLRHGAADQPAFDARLRPLGSLGADDLDIDAAAVQRAIRPQAAGWLGLACLVALAGLAVVGQAAARQFTVDADDHQTLAALGLGVRQFVDDRPRAGGGHRNGWRCRRRRARGSPVAADPGRRSAARGRRGGRCRARPRDHHAGGSRRGACDRGSLGLARGPQRAAAPPGGRTAVLPRARRQGSHVDRRASRGRDRGKARARARTRPAARPRGHRPARQRARAGGAVRDGHLRREPSQAHRDARSLWRAVPGTVRQREPRIRMA